MSRHQSDTNARFAVGMALLLLVPLFLAVCFAWYCGRHTPSSTSSTPKRSRRRMLPELSTTSKHKWEPVHRSSSKASLSSARTDDADDDDEEEQQALQPSCCSSRTQRAAVPRARTKPRAPTQHSKTAAQMLTSKMLRNGSAALPFEWNHLTPVHFRRADMDKTRRPLSSKVSLHNVHNLQVCACVCTPQPMRNWTYCCASRA